MSETVRVRVIGRDFYKAGERFDSGEELELERRIAERHPLAVEILEDEDEGEGEDEDEEGDESSDEDDTESAGTALDDKTRSELYEMATELDISGRSSMTKEELIDAIDERAD